MNAYLTTIFHLFDDCGAIFGKHMSPLSIEVMHQQRSELAIMTDKVRRIGSDQPRPSSCDLSKKMLKLDFIVPSYPTRTTLSQKQCIEGDHRGQSWSVTSSQVVKGHSYWPCFQLPPMKIASEQGGNARQ